jgi:hypothetical protein
MTYVQGFETPTEAFAEIFSSSSWSDVQLAKKIILAKIDKIIPQVSPLAARMKSLNTINGTDPKWIEEQAYPYQLTGTFVNGTGVFTVTGNLFQATPTRANMLKIARTLAVLRMELNGVTHIAQVSAVDAALPKLTLGAISGTDLPADSPVGTTYTWNVIGEPVADADPATNPRFLARKFRKATTQIFSDTFQIEKTRKMQAMEGVTNEFEEQVNALLKKMALQQAQARLQQWPLISSGQPQTMLDGAERPLLCGLTWWPRFLFDDAPDGASWTAQWNKFDTTVAATPLRNLAAANLTEDDLDNLCGAMYDNWSRFDEGEWVIATHPWVRDYMHEYGMAYRRLTQDSKVAGALVEEVKLKRANKSVPLVMDPYLPRGTALLVNLSNVGRGYLEGDEIQKGELPADSIRHERWQITCQEYGIVVREAPTSIGMIYNIGDGH